MTTFNLDAHVFDAVRAGASGFLLKDARPAELLEAIRTVAAGDALLSPAVTRALIGRFGDRVRPPAARGERGRSADPPARAGGARAHRRGSLQRRDLRALVISHETVKTYVSRILGKLQLRDRVQAVVLAHRVGLVDPR